MRSRYAQEYMEAGAYVTLVRAAGGLTLLILLAIIVALC